MRKLPKQAVLREWLDYDASSGIFRWIKEPHTIGSCLGEIDHIDGNPLNNSIANLRLSTRRENARNRGPQSNNRSGLKGAYYHACHKGKKWRTQIKVGDDVIFLGYFHTAQEAHEAYGRAAIKYFGEFARVG